MMRNLILLLFIFSLLSCKRKWTQANKAEFYAGCLNNATKNKDIKDPKSYCGCLLEKVVARYPNANDAKYIQYDSTARQLALDCLKQQ